MVVGLEAAIYNELKYMTKVLGKYHLDGMNLESGHSMRLSKGVY